MSEETYNEPTEVASNPTDVLWKLRRKKLLCDGILKTGDGGEFQVHRIVMVTCSPYFTALYTNPINVNPDRQITVPGVSAELLDIVIEYAYTRRTKVTSSNVYPLIEVADQLNIINMIKDCSELLSCCMNFRNCILIRRNAKSYYCKHLEAEAQKFLMKNFTNIMQEQEYLELKVDEISEIINNEELNVKDETEVWEAVIRWIDHEPLNRSVYIVNLMRCVRLGLMDKEYFITKVKRNRHIINNEDCRQIILEAMPCVLDLDVAENLKFYLQRPRLPQQVIIAIAGWGGEMGGAGNFIESYDFNTDVWMPITTIDKIHPVAYHKCAVVDHKIYVIGGFDGIEYFNSCHCFDAITFTWKEIAPMYTKRCYVSVAVLERSIYALGGNNGTERLNSTEKYDCDTNQWQVTDPMNYVRSDASAATLQNFICIVGGFDGNQILNSAELYNPNVNQWTVIPPMRTPRSGVCCCGYDGNVYVFGGFDGLARLYSGEKYDMEKNKWSSLPDMFTPRSNFALTRLDEYLFAMGGFDGNSTTSSVECYSIKTMQWYQAQDLVMGRSALAACVLENLPNIRDYIPARNDVFIKRQSQQRLQLESNNKTCPTS